MDGFVVTSTGYVGAVELSGPPSPPLEKRMEYGDSGRTAESRRQRRQSYQPGATPREWVCECELQANGLLHIYIPAPMAGSKPYESRRWRSTRPYLCAFPGALPQA